MGLRWYRGVLVADFAWVTRPNRPSTPFWYRYSMHGQIPAYVWLARSRACTVHVCSECVVGCRHVQHKTVAGKQG